MASSNACWGIELGSGSIKALKLTTDGDGLKVLDFLVIPHKKVLSTPDLDQNEAVRVALGELVSQRDLSGASIAVSVPGNSAFARFAKLPPVEPRQVAKIVEFEARQQIPFPIEEVEWDYQTFANKESPDLEVGIFAMRRDSVMEKLAVWADVGITPDYITLSPIAAFNAVAYDLNFSEKTPGTVILDVGTPSTDLVVAEAGRVWVRTFPLGGHQFTEALVEAFKLTYPKAEKLKREAETSKLARHVFQAMRPVFQDLQQDVQRSIGYYQSLHRDANLTRLLVFGSTFNLPGLKKYLGQQLQMEVVQLPQFNRMSFDGPQSGEFQAATVNMATAYGLALQGLGLNAINANLMPKAVLRDAMWKSKTKWFGIAAALSVAAGGASFLRYFLDQQRVEASGRPAIIEQTAREKKGLEAEWKTVEANFVPDFRAANSIVLLDGRDVIPWIVDDVGQMLGAAAKVAEASGKKGGSAEGFKFQKLTTQYFAAGASDSMDEYSSGYDDAFGGRDEASFMSQNPRATRVAPLKGQPPQAPPNAPPAPAPASAEDPSQAADPDKEWGPGQGPPRVLVTLQVATSRPEVTENSGDNPSAVEFARDTLQAWLLEAAKEGPGRELVPYTIKHMKWHQYKAPETIPEEKPDPATTPTPTVDGVVGTPDPAGSGIRIPNPSQKGGRGGQDGIQGRVWSNDPGGYTGGPASGGANTAGLDGMAPLPKAEPLGAPGSKVYFFEVTWEAYLKTATKTKEGA